MAPLAARATRCWLRVRISTRFVAYGRVLTERFARHRASAGDDYACGRRLAHLPLHVVSGENLVWVSWMDYDWAWALQSPWRRRLLDHRRLFLVCFLFCALLLLLIPISQRVLWRYQSPHLVFKGQSPLLYQLSSCLIQNVRVYDLEKK
jgi:hypothetical protein